MNYLFDSDHVSFLQRTTGAGALRLQQQIAAHPTDLLFVSIVSFHEQWGGCIGYINQARATPGLLRGYELMRTVLRTYQQIAVVDFDQAAGAVYDGLLSRHSTVGRFDLRIAAIALARGMTLLTRNRADFAPIANLAIEDWIT